MDSRAPSRSGFLPGVKCYILFVLKVHGLASPANTAKFPHHRSNGTSKLKTYTREVI